MIDKLIILSNVRHKENAGVFKGRTIFNLGRLNTPVFGKCPKSHVSPEGKSLLKKACFLHRIKAECLFSRNIPLRARLFFLKKRLPSLK